MFAKIGRVKFFYHSPARIVECVSEYTFLISKNKQTSKKQQQQQQQQQEYKKVKETKEEKRVSPENRLEKINLGLPG